MRAILTYHSIDESRSPISISPAAFRRHVRFFVSAGVKVMSVEDLLKRKGGESAVALTFDDGYANFEREAAPVLLDHALPATIFVVTGSAGGTNRWPGSNDRVPELSLLDWDALARLTARGFQIGSHTRTHQYLPRLTGARIEEEIAGAARDLSDRLGIVPGGLAYPYGAVCPRTIETAGRSHQWACRTTFAELSGGTRLELPRIDMWYFEREGRLERWGTPSFRRWVRRRRRLRQIRSAARRLLPS